MQETHSEKKSVTTFTEDEVMKALLQKCGEHPVFQYLAVDKTEMTIDFGDEETGRKPGIRIIRHYE